MSPKTTSISNALRAVASIVVGYLLSLFAPTLSVTQWRFQAVRERYEARTVTNSFSPGAIRIRTRFKMVHESLGDIFDALLIIVFGSALITTVANTTTGTAAKNGNVTASPGAAAIITLLPFIFVAIIAFAAFDMLKRRK